MSATDEMHGQLDTGYPHSLRPELHKALKARGIDYWVAQGITFWNRDDGCECLAYGYQTDGVPKLAIKVVGFTDPAQAIAATICDTDATPTRQGDADLAAENAKLRELVRDIYGEYRYLRVRFHRTYVQHEERMRAIEQRMRELGVEVD